eukprot:m.56069 g.56069  ORF g.56069 m.56069 type:complete len:51 (-) comp11536_c2_seq2:1211-1363(-)
MLHPSRVCCTHLHHSEHNAVCEASSTVVSVQQGIKYVSYKVTAAVDCTVL